MASPSAASSSSSSNSPSLLLLHQGGEAAAGSSSTSSATITKDNGASVGNAAASANSAGGVGGDEFSVCRLCNNRIMSSRLSNLTNHVRRHASLKQYRCCHCVYAHNEMAKVRLHMSHNHQDFDSNPVDQLTFEMQLQWGLLMEQCFPEHAKRFGPSAANTQFRCLDQLQKHVDLERQYACLECGELVAGYRLVNHLDDTHRAECAPSACGECGYESSSQWKVRLHISVKHAERAAEVAVEQRQPGTNFMLFLHKFFSEIRIPGLEEEVTKLVAELREKNADSDQQQLQLAMSSEDGDNNNNNNNIDGEEAEDDDEEIEELAVSGEADGGGNQPLTYIDLLLLGKTGDGDEVQQRLNEEEEEVEEAKNNTGGPMETTGTGELRNEVAIQHDEEAKKQKPLEESKQGRSLIESEDGQISGKEEEKKEELRKKPEGATELTMNERKGAAEELAESVAAVISSNGQMEVLKKEPGDGEAVKKQTMNDGGVKEKAPLDGSANAEEVLKESCGVEKPKSMAEANNMGEQPQQHRPRAVGRPPRKREGSSAVTTTQDGRGEDKGGGSPPAEKKHRRHSNRLVQLQQQEHQKQQQQQKQQKHHLVESKSSPLPGRVLRNK